MPQRSLLRRSPQRVVDTVLAMLLLVTAPALAPAATAPPPRVVVALDDSAAAAASAAHLPPTVTFHDRMGVAVFAPLPAALATGAAPAMTHYRAGDVAYVVAEQSIVVFLTDGAAVPQGGLMSLGHLEDGGDDLTSCAHGCAVELALVP